MMRRSVLGISRKQCFGHKQNKGIKINKNNKKKTKFFPSAGTIPTLILNYEDNKIFIWKTGGGYHSLIFKESK